MNKTTATKIAKELEEKASALRAEIAQAEAMLRAPRPSGGDEADQAQHLNENASRAVMRDRSISQLKLIGVAINKFKAGTLGECESCGCDIEERRLQANPAAAMCFECQNDNELAAKKRRVQNGNDSGE